MRKGGQVKLFFSCFSCVIFFIFGKVVYYNFLCGKNGKIVVKEEIQSWRYFVMLCKQFFVVKNELINFRFFLKVV